MLERLAQLSTGKRIVKNFFSLAIANIIKNIISFVTIAYLARVLRPAGFGQISFALAILTYFMIISDLGLNVFGIREIARDKAHINKYVNNIITMKVILALISFGLLLITAVFINKAISYKILIIFYGLSLFPAAISLDWAFQGVERMELIGMAIILRSLVYAGLVFLFVNNPAELLNVPLFAMAAAIVTITPLIYIFLKNYGRIFFSFNWSIWKKYLSQSLPIGLSAILVTIYYNLDTVMLGFMKKDEIVGCYNAAYIIVLALISFQSLLGQAIYPLISQYHREKNYKAIEKIINIYVKGVFSISIPMALGGTLLSKPLMNFFFGIQYMHGVIAFQILIWSLTVILSLGMLMNATDRQKTLLIGTGLGAAANIVLNLLLIPKFSMVGAAVATLLTEIITLIYFVHESQKIINLSAICYVYKPVIASIIMGGVLLVSNQPFLIAILEGVAVYIIIFLMIKGVSKEDIQLIKRHLLPDDSIIS